MNVITLIVSAACALAGLAAGLIFGSMPLRSHLMTARQKDWQQWWGIGFIVVVLGLMILKQDIPSWSILVAAVVGIAVARIPPLHRAILAKFPAFEPKRTDKHVPENSSKSGRPNKKHHGNKTKKHR
jgi:hypothetical protein